MKILLSLIAICFLCGCFSRTSMMTRESYDDIDLGTSIADIKAKVGSPYSVYKKGNAEVYEYIERIDVGSNIVSENHYFLTVSDGKVVAKRTSRERWPAYDLIYQQDPNYDYYNPMP